MKRKSKRDRRLSANTFPFYASDWISSTAHAVMTLEQRSAYIDLLCHQWISQDCSLPDDDDILSGLSGLGEKWRESGATVIRQWFPPITDKPGRIGNERLLKCNALRTIRRDSGRVGGLNSGQSRRKAVVDVADTKGKPPRKPASTTVIDPTLQELIVGWNGLGDAIVRPGNGVGDNPPPKAVLAAWKRVTRNRELRNAVSDVPALLDAIRKAQFCHCQGWFTLPWIFGKNKNGELNAERLLAGCFTGDSTKTPVPAEEAPKLRYLL